MKPSIHRLSWFIAICLFSSLLAGAAGIYGIGRLSHSASAQQRDLSTGAAISTETRAQVAEAYGKLPLRFETNRGQADARVKFISRNSGHTLFLTADEAVLSLRKPGTGDHSRVQSSVVRMKLAGANRQPLVTGFDELAGKSNYFSGDDPKQWQKNVANYAQVKYSGIYPGIDLVWYGNQRQLEHDFLVAPGNQDAVGKVEQGAECRERLLQEDEMVGNGHAKDEDERDGALDGGHHCAEQEPVDNLVLTGSRAPPSIRDKVVRIRHFDRVPSSLGRSNHIPAVRCESCLRSG